MKVKILTTAFINNKRVYEGEVIDLPSPKLFSKLSMIEVKEEKVDAEKEVEKQELKKPVKRKDISRDI